MAALEQKRNREPQMTGQHTGLGALALPLAEYLGKVQQRCASLEFCPWCAAKGLKVPVHSYRLNYQESINLCTNPQCLFPLVSRPLEDVLAGLVTPEPKSGAKRKTTSEPKKDEEAFVPSPKRLRSKGNDSPLQQNGTDMHSSKTDLADETVDGGDKRSCASGMVGKLNGSHQRDPDRYGFEAADRESLGENTVDAVKVLVRGGSTDAPTSPEAVSVIMEEHCSSTDTPTSPEAVSVIMEEHCSSTDAPTSPEAVSVIMEEHCSPTDAPTSPEAVSVIMGEHCSSTDAPTSPEAVSVIMKEHCSSTDALTSPEAVSVMVENKRGDITMSMLPMSSPHKAPGSGDAQLCNTGSRQVESQCTWSTDRANTDGSSDRPPSLSPVKVEQKVSTLDGGGVVESELEKKLVSHQLFWKNENNLCWLDALLVALVNCRTLRQAQPKAQHRRSCVWQLIASYDEACTVIQAHQQTRDGIVPNQALQKVNSELQNLRMSIFKLLQPKLRCKFGERETPVFALPLLLKMNSWVEPLFQLTFHWEFKCNGCKSTISTIQLTKPIPSFTNILPNWHPLNATHAATCNKCCKKNQTRTMVLESVPPVMSLHFVEGLPDNDVTIYSFSFQGKHYSITTVLQYDQQRKHFVTWIHKPDGSWLEFDDLKHPDCISHVKLPVPARDIHVVFWERATDEADDSSVADESAVQSAVQSPDQSVFVPPDDSDIVCALTASDVNGVAAVGDGDSCIGSTTLLDTFEGLTHNDIVTLTLVEVKADLAAVPFDKDDQTPDYNQTLDGLSTGLEVTMSSPGSPPADQSLDELPSSDTDDLFSDPTFQPGSRRRNTRIPSRPKGKEDLVKNTARGNRKTAPAAAPSAPLQEIILPTPLSASPVSSAKTSPLPISNCKPEPPPSVKQDSRWSHLLSLHPLTQLPSVKPARKPALPNQSTPNPMRRQQIPAGLYSKPKSPLRREDDKLPLKAAAIYGAFCAKSTKPPTPPQILTPSQAKTAASRVAFPTPGVTELPKISNRSGGDSWKVPCSLGDTEALRCKLLKKLKAKKKKLLKLNQLLGGAGGEGTPAPDSTNRSSPYSVSSSSYDSNTYDQFFADLLSPATTTTSSLSPDSTGFLETANRPGGGGSTAGGASQLNAVTPDLVSCLTPPPAVDGSMTGTNDNFLEEFISGTALQQQTEMEADALSALDLFF